MVLLDDPRPWQRFRAAHEDAAARRADALLKPAGEPIAADDLPDVEEGVEPCPVQVRGQDADPLAIDVPVGDEHVPPPIAHVATLPSGSSSGDSSDVIRPTPSRGRQGESPQRLARRRPAPSQPARSSSRPRAALIRAARRGRRRVTLVSGRSTTSRSQPGERHRTQHVRAPPLGPADPDPPRRDSSGGAHLASQRWRCGSTGARRGGPLLDGRSHAGLRARWAVLRRYSAARRGTTPSWPPPMVAVLGLLCVRLPDPRATGCERLRVVQRRLGDCSCG